MREVWGTLSITTRCRTTLLCCSLRCFGGCFPSALSSSCASPLAFAEFAADCWIEIRGADDVLLYADLGRAGEVRRFVGVGPFKLKIGFAEGVKLFFDAQEVDLAPYTRNQMARLELGL